MKIYLDFDGTLVEHQYPIIGEQNPQSFNILDRLIKAEHEIILNTMRVEFQDGTLVDAINFIQKELSKIDVTYKNNFKLEHTLEKNIPPEWNWDRHLAEQCIYIDDICKGTPMCNNIHTMGQMVDWSALNKQFLEFGVYI